MNLEGLAPFKKGFSAPPEIFFDNIRSICYGWALAPLVLNSPMILTQTNVLLKNKKNCEKIPGGWEDESDKSNFRRNFPLPPTLFLTEPFAHIEFIVF